jgi:hypothetical protein
MYSVILAISKYESQLCGGAVTVFFPNKMSPRTLMKKVLVLRTNDLLLRDLTFLNMGLF